MELKTKVEDPRPARHAARRNEIIQAAWGDAATYGIAAVSLTRVAAAVGLRQPSLYSYFPSKKALIDAMFCEAANGLLAVVEHTDYPDDSPRQAARLVARTVLEFGVAHPLESQLILQRTIPGYEPSPEAYAPALKMQEIYVRKLWEAGVTDGPDIDIFTALVGGLGTQQLANEPGGNRWVSQLDTVLDMFFEHLDRRDWTGPERKQRPR